MKTNKTGISLIVLVITVVVLGILATAVISSIEDTNIANEANKTVEKYSVKQYESQLNIAYANYLLENGSKELTSIEQLRKYEFDPTGLPEKYVAKIIDGVPVITTCTAIPADMKVGDLVVYTPDALPTDSLSGPQFNAYGNSTNYTPGSMTWAYLGQDEDGNALLISRDVTNFNVTINGLYNWVYGPENMNTLCNTLYGSNVYGKARNLTRDDVNNLLGYSGSLWYYVDEGGNRVDSNEAITFGEIQAKENIYVSNTMTKPEGVYSGIVFDDILSNAGSYTVPSTNTAAYNLIFVNSSGSVQNKFALSTSTAYLGLSNNPYARYSIACISSVGGVGIIAVSDSAGGEKSNPDSYALRPVIVLNSNIQFGTKNSAGAWTLEKM